MVEIISGNFHLFLHHFKVSDISAAGLPVFPGIPLQLSVNVQQLSIERSH